MPSFSAARFVLITLALAALLSGSAEAGIGEWTSNGPPATVLALAIDPITPSTLYAGIDGFPGAPVGGVYKSTDGGASWSAINNGLNNTVGKALAIDPITPSTLYAGIVGASGTGGFGMYKSTDSGASWSAINNGLNLETMVYAVAIDRKSSPCPVAGQM